MGKKQKKEEAFARVSWRRRESRVVGVREGAAARAGSLVFCVPLFFPFSFFFLACLGGTGRSCRSEVVLWRKRGRRGAVVRLAGPGRREEKKKKKRKKKVALWSGCVSAR